MSPWVIRILRAIIAVALVGSVAVQAAVVALLWWGADDAPTGIDVSFSALGVLAIATLQVVAICIWRLLTMVRSGTVFSHGAFGQVDVMIGAIGTASVLTFAFAVVARFANHAEPGDEVAPGLVGLICGLALVVAGVALLVTVMRALLVQAVELDTRTRELQSELDEVI